MIVFANHRQERCGVYQMGLRIGRELERSLGVTYCEGWEACAAAARSGPRVVVHNWHPSTEPWAHQLKLLVPGARHIGLVHEIAASTAESGLKVFQHRMVCDPTFPADNRTIFKCVRHVPRCERRWSSSNKFTLGSFGFAVGGKLFHHVARLVSEQFPGTRLRLHIPRAFFGDDSGSAAASYAKDCRAVAPGIDVEVSHEFMTEEALLSWLGENDFNVFFYEKNEGRGVSSVIDYAIAARRPIAMNDSEMFRHVRDRLGYWPQKSLEHLFQNGVAVERLYREWSPERLVLDFQNMFEKLRA